MALAVTMANTRLMPSLTERLVLRQTLFGLCGSVSVCVCVCVCVCVLLLLFHNREERKGSGLRETSVCMIVVLQSVASRRRAHTGLQCS